MAQTPVFVVLDGIDGCGKSTQAGLLVKTLAAQRECEPLHLREPGSTPLGERIRALLLSREIEIEPPSEALLFAAARRAMLDQLVAPALAAGRDVICERFHASTFAYQSIAGGLDEQQVLGMLRTWAGSPAPDLTVILDLEARDARLRRAAPTDRIEDRGLAFQEAVGRGYRRYAQLDTRTQLIDAHASPEVIAARILALVKARLAGDERRG